MAANPYPNLGWNPVPGAPDEVSALYRKVKSAGDTLSNCHRQIEYLLGASSSWEGDAASAFRDTLDGDLKLAMRNAGRSLEKAATWLGKWEGDLSTHRDLAKKYDDAAREKKAEADKAQQRYDDSKQHPDLKLGGKEHPSQAEADAATERMRAAERELNEATTHLNNANTAYNDVIKKARALEDEHNDRAEIIARHLDEADDKLAPKEPGWFGKTLEAIGEGLKAVGEFLMEHAGTIGAIAGLLALFPTPLAPLFAGIAIGASALSMASNLASEDFRDSLTGKYGWKAGLTAGASLVGDALGVVPGVGALARAGGSAGLAIGIAKEGGEIMSAGAKIGAFTSEIVPAFARQADLAAQGAKTMDYALNGVNALANTMESVGVIPDDGLVSDANEGVKAGITGSQVSGGLKAFGADLGELKAGIDLARSVVL